MDLLFKAFADETRIRILNLLSKKELCVNEIVKILHIHQPKISRHLSYLRYAGLVTSRRSGAKVYYKLDNTSTGIKKMLLGHFSKGLFQHVGLLQKDIQILNSMLK